MPNGNHQLVNAVAESYGKALFELAQEQGKLDDIRLELADLTALLRNQPDLATLFEHPTIDEARRAESIRRIFASQVSDLTLRFLLVLSSKDRLDQLAGIAVVFDRLVKESRNEVDVDVITAQPLTPQQLQAVADKVSKAIGKRAIVHGRLDASLIGGLKIKIGDQVIDASVAYQLRSLSRQLTQRSYDIARQGEALRA